MIPVYYDETNNVWKKADESNKSKTYKWYDYDNKMWANSVTVSSTNRATYQKASMGTEIPMDDILTMQVWIPRYKYKVWNYNSDGTKTSNPQEIEITFEKENKNTSEISCTDSISGTEGKPSETCKLKETNSTCTDSTCNNKTYTHPAFTFGDEEIKGFWIGKFELSGAKTSAISSTSNDDDSLAKVMPLATPSKDSCMYYDGTFDDLLDCSNFYVLSKPNVYSIRQTSVSNFETNIMNMKNSNNIYGLSTSTDTHMIKNMEWGAVAYLSHSKYGTCAAGTCKEVNINNSEEYYTGRSGGSSSADSISAGTYKYNQIKKTDGTIIGEGKDGPSASTTHNIYGVYDMNGGAYEYTMANMISKDGTIMMSGNNSSYNSGYTGKVYDSGNYTSYTGIAYPNSKYYDKYSFSISNSSLIRSKLGDAIKEVYNTGNYGWYNDYSYLAYSIDPWFVRGGYHFNVSNAGVFNSNNTYGYARSNYSTRIIITP